MHADERRYTQGFEWIALEPYPRLSALICGSILNTNSNNPIGRDFLARKVANRPLPALAVCCFALKSDAGTIGF